MVNPIRATFWTFGTSTLNPEPSLVSNGGVLEVRNVTKRYGPLTAVRDVSFAVRPGEVLGYLGPNGSGKSTTVKMLAGLMPPTFGTIHFDGADIQEDLIDTRHRSDTCRKKRTCIRT